MPAIIAKSVPLQTRAALLRSTSLICVAALSAQILIIRPAGADPVRWDPDPATAGIQSGPGNWNTTPANTVWDDGPGPNVNFDNGDDVTFSGTGDTVTINNGPVQPDSITFSGNNYTIDDGGGATDAITVGSGAGALAINVTGTNTATIAADLRRTGGGTATITINGAGGSNGTLNLNGTNTIAGGTLALQKGTLNIGGDVTSDIRNADGNLNIGGGVTITGTVTNTGGDTVNAGIVAGNVTVSGGTFDNESTANVSGDLSVSGNGEFTNDAGAAVTGNTNVSGSAVLNADGGIFTGTVTNSGGRINITGDMSESIINNAGTTTIASGVTLSGNQTNTGGTFQNNGTVAGTVAQDSGIFRNNAGGNIDGLVTVTGGRLVAAGGSFDNDINQLSGTVRYTGDSVGNLTRSGGQLEIQAAGTLRGNLDQSGGDGVNAGTITGNVLQSGGTIRNTGDIDGTLALSGGTFTSSGGTVTGAASILDGGTLTSNAGTFSGGITNGGGQVNVAGPTTANLVNVTGTSQLTGALTGTITQNGGIINNNAGGDVSGLTTVNGGELNGNGGDFTGGVRNEGGSVNITAATSADITNASGNTVITADGDLDGNLTTAGGISTNERRIDGNVVNTGGATINTGRITGTVQVDGGRVDNEGGNIAGLTTVNGGTLNANGGAFGGGVANEGGAVNVNANTSGDFVNNTGTTTNSGTISGTLTVNGGNVENNVGGDVTGRTLITAGTLNGNGGDFSGGVRATGGVVNINANTAGGITNAGGAVAIDAGATLAGNVRNTTGTTTNAGTIGGRLTVEDGEVTNAAGAVVTGPTRVEGGTLNAAGGSFDGGINATGGNVLVTANTAGNITNAGAQVVIAAVATLNGNITQTSGTTNNAGTVDGTLTLRGGPFNQVAGADVTGLATVSGTGVLNGIGGNFTGGVLNTGGTVNIDNDTTASIENRSGTLDIDEDATLTGNVTNAGDVLSAGSIAGDFINRDNGTLNFASGQSTTVTGSFANFSGGTVQIDLGETLTTGTLTNEDGGILTVNGRLNGAMTNLGDVTSNGGSFGGVVTNNGTIDASGDVALEGGLAGDGVIDMARGGVSPAARTADVVTIGGTGITGNTTLRFDANLGANSPKSDHIVMAGGALVSGTVRLEFAVFNDGDRFDESITLIEASAGQGAISVSAVTGLPDSGDEIVYTVQQLGGAGDLVLQANTNPGIGALVGSVALTQSLIGSVINRPSSPFVSGLAYEDADPCGAGMWGRITGGQADATGSSTDENTGNGAPVTSSTKTSANYAGVQLGGDFACFNGYFNGWDLAFGGIGGVNQGSISQPIFALNSAGGAGGQISETSGKFRQYFGGVYTTAAKGPLAVDLQYRLEKTDFSVTNRRNSGAIGLGLDNNKFSSKAQTLSGSVSYAFPIKDTPFTILPTAGFAWTKTSTDEIKLLGTGDTVQLQDFDNKTLFLGASAARSVVAEDGNSAVNQFITATYYNDFAAAPTATFTDNSTGSTRSIALDNLGAYGELSLGVSYVRILNPGQIGAARQLNASIRADARMGKQLDSWGITGQVRLQF